MPHFEEPAAAWQPWLLFGVAAVFSYLLGFAVRRTLLFIDVVDHPNDRSNHSVPTLRGGGIGIMITIWVGFLAVHGGDSSLLSTMVLTGSFVLAVVSFLDDRYSLAWSTRIAFQLLVSIVVVVAFFPWGHPTAAPWLWLFVPLLVLWVAGYANAFNFMDGVNGIAGFQALLTGVGTALIGIRVGLAPDHPTVVLSVLLAGGAVGFLPHNFPSARMFMGDVGSVPLGFLLSILAVWIAAVRGWSLLLPLGFLHANYVLDTGITLVRRWRRGEVVHQAHREHFYQRAVRAGASHFQVTMREASLQLLIVAMATWVAGRDGSWGEMAVVAVFVLACWSAFFVWCERKFQASLPRG